jgi:hypothetical protein
LFFQLSIFFKLTLTKWKMPRVGFIGIPLSEEDRRNAKRIQEDASDTADKVLREIDQFESFLESNPEVPKDQAVLMFGAQWLSSGRKANSLHSILQDFQTFGVFPGRLNEARDRVEVFRTRNGVKRMAASRGVDLVRKIPPPHRSTIPAEEPGCPEDADRFAFWCLLCVTGNRAANVLVARKVVADSKGVTVSWGVRKIRSDVTARCLYDWTEVPHLWIIRRWNRLVAVPWPFPSAKNIASAVCKWLKRWGLDLTSTAPREALDRVLLERYKKQELLAEEFEILMDHSVSTGLTHYRRAGDP